MLVLIQVASLRSARQAHALPYINSTKLNLKRKPDGCEVAAEPLGDPSHYSRRASIFRFLSLVLTSYKRQLDLRSCSITAGLTSPI